VKSSESPGRKNPIRSPVSANNTTSTPNDDNKSVALSGFRASTAFTVLPGHRPDETAGANVRRGHRTQTRIR
jgi:hypothetical protein